MSGSSVRVEVCKSWQEWKPMRLDALADTPIGFGELHADAVAQTEEQWEERWARPSLRLLAYGESGPVGMAGGFRREDGTPVLFAVYVRPASRGQGVLAALVEHVVAWAAPDPLVLDVHEDNLRAHRAYLKLGFVETGGRSPYDLDPTRELIAMRRSSSLQVEAALG